MDYGCPERKQKFLGTAEAYFVCHIGLIFQISLIYAFIGCPQYVLYIIHILYILTFIFKIKSIRSMPTRDLYADWGIFGYNPWVPINNNIIRREQAELRARPQMGGVKIPNFCQIIVGQQTLVVALCDAKKAKSKCSRIRSFGYDPWVPINTCNFITIYHIIRREQARPQMGGVSKFPKDRIRERLLFAFFAPHSATTKFQCPTIIWRKLYRAIFFFN